MIGHRTRAREVALQALYCHDLCADLAATELTLDSAEAPADAKRFARELLHGVLSHRGAIDAAIAAAADNWDLERLAVVDRNVLRLAVHEMLDRDDIPPKVSINEAIELGKRYSTAQSGAFVNGILDRIRRDLGLPADGEAGRAAPREATADAGGD